MKLNRLFLCTTGVLLALVSLMLARSIQQDWRTVDAAKQGLDVMEISYLAMRFAEKASAERGPTIPVLNDKTPTDPAKRERLTLARAATDQAINAALDRLNKSKLSESIIALTHIIKAQGQLRIARQEVERVAQLSFDERVLPGSQVRREPIRQMFAVIDTCLDAVTVLVAGAQKVYPELSQPLEGARLGAVLREYAGRIGSQFTAPLAAQKLLGPQEQSDIPVLVGRIEQLRQLIQMQAHTNASEPRVVAALAQMNNRYFAVGLPFIAQLTKAGLTDANYGVDSAQFVARYVPEMSSLVQLRDSMYELAREGADQQIARAQDNLQTTALIGTLILLVEVAVLLTIRRRILKPLLKSTQDIVALGQGDLERALEVSNRTDEIGDMQRALAILKATSLSKHALEQDRDHLIQKLQTASETDYLSGLLNRRAFIERATGLLATAVRNDWSITLMLLDLDHFKLVNDMFGHAQGDQVLAMTAQMIKTQIRQGDMVARYGGEEFIVFAPNCALYDSPPMSERIRAAIAQMQFGAADSESFSISASVGTVSVSARSVENLELLMQQADKALYRAKAQGRNRVVDATSAQTPA
jgi:diguanylate cyclase (GGDEF)-like protein